MADSLEAGLSSAYSMQSVRDVVLMEKEDREDDSAQLELESEDIMLCD